MVVVVVVVKLLEQDEEQQRQRGLDYERWNQTDWGGGLIQKDLGGDELMGLRAE